VFNERLNLCDDGENFGNTKKSTIHLIPEHHFDKIRNYD